MEKLIGIVMQCDKDYLECRLGTDSRRLDCTFPRECLKVIINSLVTGCKIEVRGIRSHPRHKFTITSVKKVKNEMDVEKAKIDLKGACKVTEEMLKRKVTI